MADFSLLGLLALGVVDLYVPFHVNPWLLLALSFLVPTLVLTPLIGALCNTLPKQVLLVGAAGYGLIVVAGFQLLSGRWFVGWALVALGTAIYRPGSCALTPAAFGYNYWPLTPI